MARRDVSPIKDLESPFKHPDQYNAIAWSSSYSSVLEDLYRFTITSVADKEELWVSITAPFQIKLKLETIQEAVREEKLLDTDCFNLAVRNMLADDAENFQSTKCLGWRHCVYQDWAKYAISGVEYWDARFTSSWFSHNSTAYDAFNSHLVLIPVLHDGHWTLYGFNMCNRKLSILDSLRGATERHENIRLKICGALNQTLGRAFDGSEDDFREWEFQFPRVPMQRNSFDCGFFVFNFMRFWDGHKLVQSFSTEPRELRRDFLAYILSCKGNMATLPICVASWIIHLSERKNYITSKCRQHVESYPMEMDRKLQKALMEDNVDAFKDLLSSQTEAIASASIAPTPTVSGTEIAAAPHATTDQNSMTQGEAPLLRSMLQRGLITTSTGDGVLHIAARHGSEDIVRAILSEAEVYQEEHESAVTTSPRRHSSAGPMRLAEFLRARNQIGETCLHEAIRFGISSSLVHRLIAVDASLNDATRPALVQILDHEGMSPLYLATTLRRVDIIKALTDKDYNYSVSYAGPDAKTALHAAVLLSTELCELLLSWNKSLAKSTDNLGRTPLHYLGTSDTAIAKLILNLDDAPSSGYSADAEGCLPIHVAASRGRLDIIRMIVEKCPDCISSCNTSGQTFLHIAVNMGHSDIVAYVCRERKLSTVLNMRDTNGDTALHLAVQKGDEFIFWRLLGNKNVHLSFINRQGRTPLDLAISSIDSELKYKYKRKWIRDDLVYFEADLSANRWDDLMLSKHVCWDKDYHTINIISKIIWYWAYWPKLIFLKIIKSSKIIFLNIIKCNVPINQVCKILWDGLRNLTPKILCDGSIKLIRKVIWDGPICFIRKYLYIYVIIWDDCKKLIHDTGDRIFSSSNISERDVDKESKRLGKSATVLAAGALVILTISFQMPFNAVDKKRLSLELADGKRTQTFARLVAVDSVAMSASVLCIFFCTIAGYPSGRFWIRSRALILGGVLLCSAAVAILLVFALGLSLVYSYPRWWISILANSMIPIFGLLFYFITKNNTGSPSQFIASLWARLRRTGLSNKTNVGGLLLKNGFIQFLIIYVPVVLLLINLCAPFLVNYLAPEQ